MKITDFLAVLGLVLSTISLTLNFINFRRKLLVNAMIGFIGEPGSLDYESDTNYLIINFTNMSKTPIQIVNFGAKLKKRDTDGSDRIMFVEFFGKLPVMLKEAETGSIFIDYYEVVLEDYKYFYLGDSYNREWKISKENLKTLRSNAVDKT